MCCACASSRVARISVLIHAPEYFACYKISTFSNWLACSEACCFCHVMWARKQEAGAEWQECATPAAALRHVKAEGAPSTLQQVQIERAAKNSKPRNGFEFSLKPPTAASPHQSPQSQAASAPTTTQSIGTFVEVLSSSNCDSCRGKLCGVTSSCSQCKRGVHEHCFVTMEGEGHPNHWCFACACRGCEKPLVTPISNRASNANAMCILNLHLMVHVSSVRNPYARLAPPPCPLTNCLESWREEDLEALELWLRSVRQ